MCTRGGSSSASGKVNIVSSITCNDDDDDDGGAVCLTCMPVCRLRLHRRNVCVCVCLFVTCNNRHACALQCSLAVRNVSGRCVEPWSRMEHEYV